MMDKDWGVVRIDNFESLTTQPTKCCLICDKLENPNAHMVYEAGWICPNCKMKIKALFLIHDLVVRNENENN